MVFLSPCADESLVSLLARVARANGYADFRSLIENLFPSVPCVSFINSEFDFPRFCLNTDNVYGDPLSVLELLTSKKFEGRATDGKHVLTSIAQGIHRPSLADLTFFSSPILRFCPECRDEDLSKIGMTYWRRIHQLPIVFYCPTHGGVLCEVKIHRKQLHQMFPLPSDFSVDVEEQSIVEKNRSSFWLGVSLFVERFAKEDFAADDLTICDLILDSLHQRKLAGSRGDVRVRQLVEEFRGIFDDFPTGRDIARKSFSREFAAGVKDPSNGSGWARLVLLTWLFGSWERFLEHYQWACVFGRRYIDPQWRRSKIDAAEGELAQRYKQKCLEFLKANPGCSRSQFLHGDYRTFRWLRRNEKGWLEKELPRHKWAGDQLDLL